MRISPDDSPTRSAGAGNSITLSVDLTRRGFVKFGNRFVNIVNGLNPGLERKLAT